MACANAVLMRKSAQTVSFALLSTPPRRWANGQQGLHTPRSHYPGQIPQGNRASYRCGGVRFVSERLPDCRSIPYSRSEGVYHDQDRLNRADRGTSGLAVWPAGRFEFCRSPVPLRTGSHAALDRQLAGLFLIVVPARFLRIRSRCVPCILRRKSSLADGELFLLQDSVTRVTVAFGCGRITCPCSRYP